VQGLELRRLAPVTTAASSRPGPRADLNVRSILLDTAEQMFAVEGVAGVSLRAIGREADVSSAGVLYHYPTKQALVAAVIRRRGEGVGTLVRKNFQHLLASNGPVSARKVVDAILVPLVDLINADPQGGLFWAKIFTQLAQTNDEIWIEQITAPPDLTELFLDSAVRALPDVTSAAVRARLGIAMFSMLTALAGSDRGGAEPQFSLNGLDPEFVEQLARFTAAGMSAP
jgi:AcrR family transcriptional regulator